MSDDIENLSWKTIVNGKEVSNEAKIKEQTPAVPAPHWMDILQAHFRKGLNIACNLMIWGVLVGVGAVGGIAWQTLTSAPDYSEMQSKLSQAGHPVEGDKLAELGKICRNGAGSPMACQVLVLAKESE